MIPRWEIVSLQRIQALEKWRYRLDDPSDLLRASIRFSGVISPLLLVEQKKGIYWIVDGFQRYFLASEEGLKNVPALVYPAENQEIAFWHGLQQNGICREFSVAEKARVVYIVLDFQDRALQDHIWQWLGVPSRPSLLQRYRELAHFPTEIIQYFHRYRFSWRQIERLWPLRVENLLPWAQLASSLHLKAQEFVQIMEQVWDVSLRENVSVKDLFSQLQKELSLPSGMPESQRVRLLKEYLHRLRYPIWHKIQQQVKQAAEDFQKHSPIPIQVHWDPTLERTGVGLQLWIESPEQLPQFAKQLTKKELVRRFEHILQHLKKMEE